MNITAVFHFTFCGENVVFVEDLLGQKRLTHATSVYNNL